jgi:hypothetical protein
MDECTVNQTEPVPRYKQRAILAVRIDPEKSDCVIFLYKNIMEPEFVKVIKTNKFMQN